jgi:hypothetical protein
MCTTKPLHPPPRRGSADCVAAQQAAAGLTRTLFANRKPHAAECVVQTHLPLLMAAVGKKPLHTAAAKQEHAARERLAAELLLYCASLLQLEGRVEPARSAAQDAMGLLQRCSIVDPELTAQLRFQLALLEINLGAQRGWCRNCSESCSPVNSDWAMVIGSSCWSSGRHHDAPQ